MKYLKNALLILVGSIFFCSCTEADLTQPVYKSIEVGKMQASINGTLFSSANIQTVDHGSDIIKITAADMSTGLTLAVSSRNTGLYTIGGDEANFLSYTTVQYVETGSVETIFTSQQILDAKGTIEILETDLDNHTISGIFSGTIMLDGNNKKTMHIENGLFNQVPF